MSKQRFENNVSVTINEFLSTTDTTITVSSTARFPTLEVNDWIIATIVPQGGQSGSEIVKITAISGNSLTVVRGQEGTIAQSFDYGALLELRVTKGSLEFLRDHPGIINVKTDHGATGNGTTDDSAAINAASLAASVAGKSLYFPGGTYIGKNLIIYTNSVWFGEGRNSVIKLANSALATDKFIANNNRGTNIDGSDATNDTQIVIENLQFDGNKVNQTQVISTIFWRRVQFSTIRGCRFINSGGMALDLTNAIDHNVIDGNVFQNNVGKDISIRWVSNRNIISNNVIIGSNLSVADGGEAGTVSDDAIIISQVNNSGGASFNCAENLVIGNVIKGKRKGLIFDGVFNSHVSDNVFGTQTEDTIVIQGTTTYFCQGLIIANNSLELETTSGFVGLQLTGERLVITGNNFLSAAQTCIYIASGNNNKDINVNENVLKFTGSINTVAALRVRDATILSVSHNTIWFGKHAIHLDTPSVGQLMSEVSITGNTINQPTQNGIRIDNGGVSRDIKNVTITSNIISNYGSQAVNTYDGIFIEQVTGVIADVYINGNTFYDNATKGRDAIRFSGTLTASVIEPNQKIQGINGVIATGYFSSAPTIGAWKAGQRITNFSPVASGIEGWVCVTSGTPGTWKTFGTISA